MVVTSSINIEQERGLGKVMEVVARDAARGSRSKARQAAEEPLHADVHVDGSIGRVRRRQTNFEHPQSRRSGLVQAAGANYEDPT
jgi:hypothetical protein